LNANALKGMPVISMADGAKIGTVKDVLFDPSELRAAGLVLVMAGGESLLPFGSVRSIGADAITVETTTTSSGVTMQGAVEDLSRLAELVGLPILSGEGTHLGQVTDVAIDPGDGHITGLAVQRGGLLGIGATRVTIEGSAIRGIGPSVVTVEASKLGGETPPASDTTPPGH